MSAAMGPIRAGTLRALGVTTATRASALPGVATVAETVPGYEASAATGIGAPLGTPAEIVERLNRAVNAAFVDRAMMGRLAETGGMPLRGSPTEFGRMLADETEKWGKVVRFAQGTK
jgi:tripartite-type tricarboxylate transporter receptor subunit TctC